jgi:hypothetical protein
MLGSKSNFARPETTEASFAGRLRRFCAWWRTIFGSSLVVQFKKVFGRGLGAA